MKQKIKIYHQRIKTKEDWQTFWKEWRKKEKEMQSKNMAFERVKHETELRALPVGAKIGYKDITLYGPGMKLNGKWGKKVRDLRKRMLVDFRELGKWSVPYEDLTTDERAVIGNEAIGRKWDRCLTKY